MISVGNLSFGGTGKTPFTIKLYEIFENDYKHIVIISRGYKRQTKGALIVSINGSLQLEVEESGDEPYLIALKCLKASVVVAENRIEGFELIAKHNPDLVILDDGFQNFKIHKDLNILLTSGYHPFWLDSIFPMGMLRELKSNYKRANLICVTKKEVSSHKYGENALCTIY